MFQAAQQGLGDISGENLRDFARDDALTLHAIQGLLEPRHDDVKVRFDGHCYRCRGSAAVAVVLNAVLAARAPLEALWQAQLAAALAARVAVLQGCFQAAAQGLGDISGADLFELARYLMYAARDAARAQHGVLEPPAPRDPGDVEVRFGVLFTRIAGTVMPAPVRAAVEAALVPLQAQWDAQH